MARSWATERCAFTTRLRLTGVRPSSDAKRTIRSYDVLLNPTYGLYLPDPLLL